ncbi:unnamed protein product [Caenorhabditis angaria]|uniref:Uncharacterized protein n=1 Tax=Caenorhabditis angaria TaxID=860376 RepID=A0A9P1N6R5_9PELO|nr:unnamed protein product [Caenorhabditis angaria]
MSNNLNDANRRNTDPIDGEMIEDRRPRPNLQNAGIRVTNIGNGLKKLWITKECFRRIISIYQTDDGVVLTGEFAEEYLKIVVGDRTEIRVSHCMDTPLEESNRLLVNNSPLLQQPDQFPHEMLDDEETWRGYENVPRNRFEVGTPVMAAAEYDDQSPPQHRNFPPTVEVDGEETMRG